MAQPDTAVISRALTDLGTQIPLIRNHPMVQSFQNFQEEARGQFTEFRGQFTELQRTMEEMRQDFRIGLDQISREFVPSHIYYYR